MCPFKVCNLLVFGIFTKFTIITTISAQNIFILPKETFPLVIIPHFFFFPAAGNHLSTFFLD